VINITDNGPNSSGVQVRSHFGNKKVNQTYGEIFTLINNTENFDKRGKQSMLRPLMFQLDHMDSDVYQTQITVMEETMNEFQLFDKDMYKITSSLRNKLSKCIDEKVLGESYEAYEKAFNNFDRTNNQKQLDSMLTGATKYLTALKELFTKELTDADLAHKVKSLTGFIQKLSKDISNVQNGLSTKAKKLLDEIIKEQDQGKKKGSDTKSGSKKPLGSQRQSSPSKKTNIDVLETELKEQEVALIANLT
jgi:hypothetical protein